MHGHRIVAFYEVRLPAASLEEAFDLFVRHTSEDGRVSDLVTVQVQDRKNRTVIDRVQEFIGLPGGSKRAGLCLAVADGNRCDQVGVIENRTECMGNAVSELAAFVDGTGGLGSAVAGHAAREGEALKHLRHTRLIFADVRVDLAVAALQVAVSDEEVSAVSGTGKKDQIQIVTLDHTVQMNIYEVLAGNGSPVSYDLLLDAV